MLPLARAPPRQPARMRLPDSLRHSGWQRLARGPGHWPLAASVPRPPSRSGFVTFVDADARAAYQLSARDQIAPASLVSAIGARSLAGDWRSDILFSLSVSRRRSL